MKYSFSITEEEIDSQRSYMIFPRLLSKWYSPGLSDSATLGSSFSSPLPTHIDLRHKEADGVISPVGKLAGCQAKS